MAPSPIRSLALFSVFITLIIAFYSPSTFGAWPGDTVSEKIDLLIAVYPQNTVGDVLEYCKARKGQYEEEWKKKRYSLMNLLSKDNGKNKTIRLFTKCVFDSYRFKSFWKTTLLNLLMLEHNGGKGTRQEGRTTTTSTEIAQSENIIMDTEMDETKWTTDNMEMPKQDKSDEQMDNMEMPRQEDESDEKMPGKEDKTMSAEDESGGMVAKKTHSNNMVGPADEEKSGMTKQGKVNETNVANFDNPPKNSKLGQTSPEKANSYNLEKMPFDKMSEPTSSSRTDETNSDEPSLKRLNSINELMRKKASLFSRTILSNKSNRKTDSMDIRFESLKEAMAKQTEDQIKKQNEIGKKTEPKAEEEKGKMPKLERTMALAQPEEEEKSKMPKLERTMALAQPEEEEKSKMPKLERTMALAQPEKEEKSKMPKLERTMALAQPEEEEEKPQSSAPPTSGGMAIGRELKRKMAFDKTPRKEIQSIKCPNDEGSWKFETATRTTEEMDSAITSPTTSAQHSPMSTEYVTLSSPPHNMESFSSMAWQSLPEAFDTIADLMPLQNVPTYDDSPSSSDNVHEQMALYSSKSVGTPITEMDMVKKADAFLDQLEHQMNNEVEAFYQLWKHHKMYKSLPNKFELPEEQVAKLKELKNYKVKNKMRDLVEKRAKEAKGNQRAGLA